MRSHMQHIHNALVKQKWAKAAADQPTSYKKYKEKVDNALKAGWNIPSIIAELNVEMERIEDDKRDGNGDPILAQGFVNARTACRNAIQLLISELKGESLAS